MEKVGITIISEPITTAKAMFLPKQGDLIYKF